MDGDGRFAQDVLAARQGLFDVLVVQPWVGDDVESVALRYQGVELLYGQRFALQGLGESGTVGGAHATDLQTVHIMALVLHFVEDGGFAH